MAAKISPKLETILEPLQISNVFFSFNHFGLIEKEYKDKEER